MSEITLYSSSLPKTEHILADSKREYIWLREQMPHTCHMFKGGDQHTGEKGIRWEGREEVGIESKLILLDAGWTFTCSVSKGDGEVV